LEQCGFRDVQTRFETHRLVFVNPEEFWGWAWSHGDRAVLESLTGNRDHFKQELFEEFAKRADVSGLYYQVFAAITTAATVA
jgi:hypothetical protein